jgi:hypothetical protein
MEEPVTGACLWPVAACEGRLPVAGRVTGGLTCDRDLLVTDLLVTGNCCGRELLVVGS